MDLWFIKSTLPYGSRHKCLLYERRPEILLIWSHFSWDEGCSHHVTPSAPWHSGVDHSFCGKKVIYFFVSNLKSRSKEERWRAEVWCAEKSLNIILVERTCGEEKPRNPKLESPGSEMWNCFILHHIITMITVKLFFSFSTKYVVRFSASSWIWS